jgi:hypothetical protein
VGLAMRGAALDDVLDVVVEQQLQLLRHVRDRTGACLAGARRTSVGARARRRPSPKEAGMRMMMRVQMEVEAANRAIRDGTWATVMERVMEDLQPEAVYFTAQDGRRTGFIVFDMKDVSDIPSIAEPFFMTVNASIDISPVMTVQDVQTGLEKASAAFAHS